MTDPRLSRTLLFKSGASTIPWAQPVGSETAEVNVALVSSHGGLQRFIVDRADIDASSAGPLAKGRASEQAQGPLVAKLDAGALVVGKAYGRVRTDSMAPVFTPWGADTVGFKPVAVGLEVVRAYREAGSIAQAQMLHSAHMGDLDLLEPFINAPRALTGLSVQQVAGLHRVAFELLKPELFAALTAEMEMINVATDAMRRAIDIAADHGASRSAIVTGAPNLAALITNKPLAWPPVRPEDAATLRAA